MMTAFAIVATSLILAWPLTELSIVIEDAIRARWSS